MIKGTKEYLDDIAKNYVCSLDGGLLVVAWHGGENSYVLRCGKGHFPEEVTRNPSLTQMLKQGEEIPEPILSNIKKGIAKRAGVAQGKPVDPDKALLPVTDLGTGELLLPEVTKSLVDYAFKYGLDPYRGHVVLMYGKPYITLDGYLYHAHETNVPYELSSRPLKPEERPIYQVKEGDHAWITTIKKIPSGSVFNGIGVVTKEEIDEESKGKPGQKRYPVVSGKPWYMAQKRADWQALRRAFPIGESKEE